MNFTRRYLFIDKTPNAELNDNPGDFDYRTKLKSPEWVKSFSTTIVSSYVKLVQRKRIDSFAQDWKNRTSQ